MKVFLLFNLKAKGRSPLTARNFAVSVTQKRMTIEPHSTDWCANVPLRSKLSNLHDRWKLQPGKYLWTFFWPLYYTPFSIIMGFHSLILKLDYLFVLKISFAFERE